MACRLDAEGAEAVHAPAIPIAGPLHTFGFRPLRIFAQAPGRPISQIVVSDDGRGISPTMTGAASMVGITSRRR